MARGVGRRRWKGEARIEEIPLLPLVLVDAAAASKSVDASVDSPPMKVAPVLRAAARYVHIGGCRQPHVPTSIDSGHHAAMPEHASPDGVAVAVGRFR